MDSTPRLIDDLRAAGDVTEQVAEVGNFPKCLFLFAADDPVEGSATSDAFEIDGELSALQAFSVIPFTDSQPDGLGYSNGWTVGPEEKSNAARGQHSF